MQAVGIIPARWGSRRFPGKVVTPIAGQPMIERVWRAVRRSGCLREVIVATDDSRVVALCDEFGAKVVMTSPDHATGTDRIAEVAQSLREEVIVNVQGDEPLLEPRVIEAALDALERDARASMSTVVHPLDREALDDPHRVKVSIDADGRASDFARTLPVDSEVLSNCWQHIGLYAYRRDFLLDFVRWPQSPTELDRDLEQWRALDGGHPIAVGQVNGWRSVPVDVPEDVGRVEAALAGETVVEGGK